MVKKGFLQDLDSLLSLILAPIFLYFEQKTRQLLGHICLRHRALLAHQLAGGQGIPYAPVGRARMHRNGSCCARVLSLASTRLISAAGLVRPNGPMGYLTPY